MNISLTARNDRKLASILLMMLSSMEYEKVSVKRHEGIGIEVKVDGIMMDEELYAEILDVMRDIRTLDDFYRDRVEAHVVIDVCGNEHEWGYFYDWNYDGNIYDEWGKIDLKEGNF